MKAAVFEQYGAPEVVAIRDIETPVPKANEVLIKVHASTVSAADWRIRSLSVPRGYRLILRLAFGFFRPRKPVLGVEVAGEVIATGVDVTRFQPGDQVFALTGRRLGGHAEYCTLGETDAIAHKPINANYEQAACLAFGGTTALDFLRRLGDIHRGHKVLVNGASGAVGTAAVQLAKYFGADVTAVCSRANSDLVLSLGADRVIDYHCEDFTDNGETYDLILDAVGTAPWPRSKQSLSAQGRLLAVVADLADNWKALLVSRRRGRRLVTGVARESAEDLRFLARLMETGVFRPVIDRQYFIEQIVEAHGYVDAGHKRGNVVIVIQ
ncbi:NAD(P)-dependent alcohol dehydrogenase [Gynuella sunshinyii]|nr:NAD(P)-dependent alcohol dehydrogenase [Gynuella sunshinyii]